MILTFVLATVCTQSAFAAKLCAFYTRTSPVHGVQPQPIVCSENGKISDAINLGDDTSWRDQYLQIFYEGPGEVCLMHLSDGNNFFRACSSKGIWSERIWMGDDSGYPMQYLRISGDIFSGIRACFRHTHVGARGFQSSGWRCNSTDSGDWTFIGDDTGYREQSLRFFVGPDVPRGQ